MEERCLGWLRQLCRAWRLLVGQRRLLAQGLGRWHGLARMGRARRMVEVLSRVAVPGRGPRVGCLRWRGVVLCCNG